MSVLSQIQKEAANLTPAETRLVRSVIESPRAAALSTVSELARSADVHEATVSRLARKLGFESYPSFRQALREEFIPSQEPATRFKKTIGSTAQDSVLGSLIRQETEALLRIESYVSTDSIVEVAERLMAARRIHIFGRGNAETLALLMVKRFRRFGRDVQKLSGDPRELAEQALGFAAGDAVLCFAFRRAPRGYRPLVEAARAAGAETIVVSGAAGPMLTPAPDHLLAAPRGGDRDAFQTLTVPMTLCNALVIAAGALDKEQTLSALERLGALMDRFD